MKSRPIAIIIIIILLLIVLPQWLYIVYETDQVIITQFGRYVATVKDAGLHARTPFVQQIHRFNKRVLYTDAPPGEYLTLDKKRLIVDYISHWKIEDPLAFFKSLITEFGAKSRIEDIVFSEMRVELASFDYEDIIAENREAIMDAVADKARERLKDFGIELIDVRIKRADLPKEVQESVFARMVAERARISKRYRSEGEEEAAKIRAQADKEREIILAEAYRKLQKLKGEGDAKAAAIYAEAFKKDPGFYSFQRTLEAYKTAITPDTLFVIPSNSEFFKYFNSTISPDNIK
ncbi:MAG TPA: protease modulator HflC [Candidatus Brocadiales bacterium]|nr:protease modulator HflC [Candidatus Brocadiales bacterium]